MESPRASNEEQRPHSETSHPSSYLGRETLTGHAGRSSSRSHQEHLSLHMGSDDGNMEDGDETHWARQSHPKPWNSREKLSAKDSGRTIPKNKERTESATGQFDDGQGSEISSFSMSDEVELDQLSSPCAQSDDEESGLTKTDDSRPNGRRRRRADLPDRTAVSLQLSRVGPKLADRSVLKTLFFNSLLVASWYIFSLSISLASLFPAFLRPSADRIAVQHLDVLSQAFGFPLPTIHNLLAYVGPILPRSSCSLPCSPSPPSSRSDVEPP